MNNELFYALLSVFLYGIGFVPYIYHVFHGRVVPHPFSWTIWCGFSLMNLIILYSSIWYTPTFFIVLIRAISLAFGALCGWYFLSRIQVGKFDIFALILAILSIGILNLYWFREVVIWMVITDMIVLLPTLRKIFSDPRSEDALIWFTLGLSQWCLLLSLPHLSFENSFFWFYAIVSNLSVWILIRFLCFRRRMTLRWRLEAFTDRIFHRFH